MPGQALLAACHSVAAKTESQGINQDGRTERLDEENSVSDALWCFVAG